MPWCIRVCQLVRRVAEPEPRAYYFALLHNSRDRSEVSRLKLGWWQAGSVVSCERGDGSVVTLDRKADDDLLPARSVG